MTKDLHIASNDVTDKSGGEKFYSASNISISIPRLPRLTVQGTETRNDANATNLMILTEEVGH